MQHVPVVVFVALPAGNFGDGASLAEIALRQATSHTTGAPPRLPVTIHAHLRDDSVPVTITYVTEISRAVLSGHLRIGPTNRAYPTQQPGDLMSEVSHV